MSHNYNGNKGIFVKELKQRIQLKREKNPDINCLECDADQVVNMLINVLDNELESSFSDTHPDVSKCVRICSSLLEKGTAVAENCNIPNKLYANVNVYKSSTQDITPEIQGQLNRLGLKRPSSKVELERYVNLKFMYVKVLQAIEVGNKKKTSEYERKKGRELILPVESQNLFSTLTLSRKSLKNEKRIDTCRNSIQVANAICSNSASPETYCELLNDISAVSEKNRVWNSTEARKDLNARFKKKNINLERYTHITSNAEKQENNMIVEKKKPEDYCIDL